MTIFTSTNSTASARSSISAHTGSGPASASSRPEDQTTELVFILDRSGSMSGLEGDTIGGFNSMIAKQKEEPGRAFVTVVLFNHKMETLVNREPLESIQEMTRAHYQTCGTTALLDAVGSTIKRVNKAQKEGLAGRPDHTIFVITTDGMENASTSFTASEVRSLIEKRQKKNGWQFIFLGANIDAIETAGSLGIDRKCAANYTASSAGTRAAYEAIDEAVCCMRASMPLDASWKDGLEE